MRTYESGTADVIGTPKKSEAGDALNVDRPLETQQQQRSQNNKPASLTQCLTASIGSRLWIAEYEFAERRDEHLAGGRTWRAAACSAALALLRLAR